MPVTKFKDEEMHRYMSGFDSQLQSEAVPGTLPVGQNSPQRPPHGLYAEKLSGTSFTAPRHENKQTWLYRILPSCSHSPFHLDPSITWEGVLSYSPNQTRWDPFPFAPAGKDTFVGGLKKVAGAGDPATKTGFGIFIYIAHRSMDEDSAFYSADGDFLLVPQQGSLDIRTELGWLLVRPLEICVIPRGVKFWVRLGGDTPGRGYALELHEGHFALPELGPIGSNGLANARDFQVPVADFDHDGGMTSASDGARETKIMCKFNNRLHVATQRHSPFDVVGWHGNYYPYKYDLGRFNTIGTISYDHPDPSIFTVLTAPSSRPGTAVADFVVFPPRWLVGENTFRPPWYHRNTMSEFMGLVCGRYDAKRDGSGGFAPGGASLHNVMSGHGPDVGSAERARGREGDGPQGPEKVGEGSCAFMFESCLMMGVTGFGAENSVQEGYGEESWGGLKVHFEMPREAGRG